jgi:hypothetical protein
MKPITTAFVIAVIGFACTNRSTYPFATKDFRPELQPHIERIIESGIAGYDSSTRYINDHATDSELRKLSRSEHPVLRLVALQIMQERDSTDEFNFIISHLDDGATVAVDEGEFGIKFRRIPDIILQRLLRWKSVKKEDKIIEKVLLEHNDLHLAYYFAQNVAPDERFYHVIREMVQRERPFEDIGYATYGLSKFKKQEDVGLIAHVLNENNWQLGVSSFRLMKEYHDSAYLSILVRHARTYFARSMMYDERNYDPSDFFEALASYKEKRVAELFPVVLTQISRLGCYSDTNYLKLYFYESFLDNKCDAYKSILPQIERGYEEVRKDLLNQQKKYDKK